MSLKKTPNELRIRNSSAEFLTFACQTGGDGVEVRVQDGNTIINKCCERYYRVTTGGGFYVR
jgi:hypothetical protein